jgi:hypothetical protein
MSMIGGAAAATQAAFPTSARMQAMLSLLFTGRPHRSVSAACSQMLLATAAAKITTPVVGPPQHL